MSLTKIETVEQWENLVKNTDEFYLLKNSTTCPISTEAYEETEKFSQSQENVPVFYLNVQEARPLSDEIANRFSVKHESPQAFLFVNGEVKWHDSHWNVTNKKLSSVWEEK